MPFLDLKRDLAEKIAKHFNHSDITAAQVLQEFSSPPNLAMGHLALPCFRLAKLLKKPTQEITKELIGSLSSPNLSISAAGPYANFRWNAETLGLKTLSDIFSNKERYGSDRYGVGKRVVIEYCSPNIAKKLAFHHIRSTLIGNTLANMYEFLGFQTERMNFVGDWGAQFARLLAAVEKWGDKQRLTLSDVSGSMDHLLEVYVRFHREVETNPSLLDLANQTLKRLEAQEPAATALWKLIREISVEAMNRTLKRMNVRFDHVEGESHYIPQIAKTLELVKSKAGGRLSEGAWIVEVEGISTPALIQKKDGTTLYLTRDVAAALDRHNRLQFDRMFYVVSEQQRLHFQLLKGVLKRMGYEWAESCEHLSFGTVLFGSEKMSTREGRVVVLDELLDEAKALALVECTQKNPDLANKEEVAEIVGIGAVVFGELSTHRQRDIEFNWKEVLAFDGETGPYVQYSAVRCQSLMEKAREKGEERLNDFSKLNVEISSDEEALILELSKLRLAVHDSVRENEPYHLTHFLIDLAKTFNRFYYRLPVLQANDLAQRQFRLALVEATGQVLSNGLSLLGIACPRQM